MSPTNAFHSVLTSVELNRKKKINSIISVSKDDLVAYVFDQGESYRFCGKLETLCKSSAHICWESMNSGIRYGAGFCQNRAERVTTKRHTCYFA